MSKLLWECPYRCTQCYSMQVRQKGKDLTKNSIDRITDQLASNGIKTVNLGGNEPLFTNGPNPKDTLLPYIVSSLIEKNILVGITTSGISINYLAEHYPSTFQALNDVDVSLDSPFSDEHNVNRGAALFNSALKAIRYCRDALIEHTIVMCGMNWNLSDKHIDALCNIAMETESNVRINFIKPTAKTHLHLVPSPKLFYETSNKLMERSEPIVFGEPLLSSTYTGTGKGCPCGIRSFRIHSITPNGKVPISPCVYMHDYAVGDMLVDDLCDIISSKPFSDFRERHENPEKIKECADCKLLTTCRGGCAARAYLMSDQLNGLLVRDSYCIKENGNGHNINFSRYPIRKRDKVLVHEDYLCTLIVKPVRRAQ